MFAPEAVKFMQRCLLFYSLALLALGISIGLALNPSSGPARPHHSSPFKPDHSSLGDSRRA